VVIQGLAEVEPEVKNAIESLNVGLSPCKDGVADEFHVAVEKSLLTYGY